MYSQGMFSIGGIASGLDTAGIVDQLMQLERQPVVRMENRQKQLQRVDDAWGQINTKLSALRKAVDAIAKPAAFEKLVAVSSSNEDAVAVSASGTAGSGSVSFRVTQLAQAHQLASGDFASADTSLDAGTFSVTVDGTTTTVELDGSQTLQDLADVLNAADGGVSASVVQIAEGKHRLVLTGNETGATKALTVSSAQGQFQAMTELRQAQDAKLDLGTDGTMEVTRSSNTISDLIPGASITLKQTTTEAVTVTAERDVDGAVKAIKGYVDALNGAIGTIADLSGYDTAAEKGGVLQGDATARSLLSRLRGAVTAPTALGEGFTSGYQVGLSVDRAGAVTLDEAKLKEALAADFDGVARLFSKTGTSTSADATVTGTSAATPGTYEVQVTRAAQVARGAGALVSPTDPADPNTFRILSDGKTATVTLDTVGATTAEIVAAIQDALAQEGITDVAASVNGAGEVELASRTYGSAASFTVESVDGYDVKGLAGTHTGVDVEGYVYAQGAADPGALITGTGQLLTGQGNAEGILVTHTGDTTATFDVTWSHGLAGGMGEVLGLAEGSDGMVARARKSIESQIDMYQDRIDAFDIRLQSRETTLRRQFTAMETALAQLQSQGNWLASQLGGLSAGMPPA